MTGERVSFRMLWRSLALFAGLALLSAPVANAGDAEYVGVKKCKMCHIKQYKSWAETPMAKAMDSLKPGESADAKTKAGLDPKKDYTTDEKCLACHSTGYGKAGGYSGPDDVALAGVSCEACHGPGSLYKKTMKNKAYKMDDVMAAGLVHPNEEVCKTCHNADNPTAGEDYSFKFDKDKDIHKHIPLKHEH